MFLTQPEAAVPLPPGLLEPGHQGWVFVEVTLAKPLFHVTYSYPTSDGGRLGRNLLCDRLEELVTLACTNGVEIRQANLLSPPALNGTDNWKLDRILEVLGSSSGIESERIYVVQGDRRYVGRGARDHAGQMTTLFRFDEIASCISPRSGPGAP